MDETMQAGTLPEDVQVAGMEHPWAGRSQQLCMASSWVLQQAAVCPNVGVCVCVFVSLGYSLILMARTLQLFAAWFSESNEWIRDPPFYSTLRMFGVPKHRRFACPTEITESTKIMRICMNIQLQHFVIAFWRHHIGSPCKHWSAASTETIPGVIRTLQVNTH